MTDTAHDGARGAEAGRDEVDALLAHVRRQRRFPWRWAVVAAGVAVVVGWAFVAGRSLGRDPTVVRSALLGKPAPPFNLPALDGGGTVDSTSMRGDVVVVNFWASWCVPCREEAPELEAFARRWSGRGVRLVGIVYNDERAAAVEFRDRYGLTYPQAIDPGGRTAIDYGVFGVPETYVVAPDGTVMAKLLGAVDAASLERVVASVNAGRTVSQQNDRYRTGPGS
ncbi:MAG: TlpA family protein disulfide reductase [Acidimicrobiia bacterium]